MLFNNYTFFFSLILNKHITQYCYVVHIKVLSIYYTIMFGLRVPSNYTKKFKNLEEFNYHIYYLKMNIFFLCLNHQKVS